jgi:hypothetical protein
VLRRDNTLTGSSLKPNLGLVTFDSVNFIELGGQMPSTSAVLFNSSITAFGSFSFPTNGTSTFTVRVPAAFSGPIQGQGDFPNFTNLNLNVSYGHLVLTFDFVPGNVRHDGDRTYKRRWHDSKEDTNLPQTQLLADLNSVVSSQGPRAQFASQFGSGEEGDFCVDLAHSWLAKSVSTLCSVPPFETHTPCSSITITRHQ